MFERVRAGALAQYQPGDDARTRNETGAHDDPKPPAEGASIASSKGSISCCMAKLVSNAPCFLSLTTSFFISAAPKDRLPWQTQFEASQGAAATSRFQQPMGHPRSCPLALLVTLSGRRTSSNATRAPDDRRLPQRRRDTVSPLYSC
jgi:hypothetical protein